MNKLVPIARSMARTVAVGAVLCLVAPVTAPRAHHSIAAAYDGTRQVTIDALVREFHFVNPHPYLIVAGTAGGSGASWRLELDNRHELIGVGMTAETFKAGDRVTVRGAPSRLHAAMLYVRELARPADGLRYEQVGSSPRLTLPRRAGGER